jgi:hypothetical protein
MTKDEALKMALETLEIWKGYMSHLWDKTDEHTITAIKEALAQPEQEPVAWKLVPRDATDEMLKAMDECSTEGYDERLYAGHAASVYMAAVDAAPVPPQRTWVHLTNEEHTELAIEWGCLSADWVFYAAAVERKVKEKNT